MKRLVAFLCIAIIFVSVSSCERNYTHGIYELTITSTLISNNSVGNEWRCEYICDGETVGQTHRMTLPLDNEEKVVIEAVITELDKRSDVGRGKVEIELKDGFESSTTVKIKEKNGRYKGSTALWEVKCKVKLIKKLTVEQHNKV